MSRRARRPRHGRAAHVALLVALTSGAYRAALAAAGRGELPLLDGWHADRRYLAALSQRVNETLDGADPNEFALLFTAHNVPLETVMEGDPYVEQLQQTVAQLLPTLMPATGASPSRARAGAAASGSSPRR